MARSITSASAWRISTRPRLTQNLVQRGLKPDENWQYGFYVKDPDGVNVQLL